MNRRQSCPLVMCRRSRRGVKLVDSSLFRAINKHHRGAVDKSTGSDGSRLCVFDRCVRCSG